MWVNRRIEITYVLYFDWIIFWKLNCGKVTGSQMILRMYYSVIVQNGNQVLASESNMTAETDQSQKILQPHLSKQDLSTLVSHVSFTLYTYFVETWVLFIS